MSLENTNPFGSQSPLRSIPASLVGWLLLLILVGGGWFASPVSVASFQGLSNKLGPAGVAFDENSEVVGGGKQVLAAKPKAADVVWVYVDRTVQSLLTQVLWIFVPVAVFALVFHGLESVVQKRLVERFGWRAAMWTGWIGTPIHESSHALLCAVFGHRIEAMALFEPDLKERRLGYVRHTYHRGNWWQEVGNFFIGLAPLAGGTVALMAISWLLYPGLTHHFWEVGAPAVSQVNAKAANEAASGGPAENAAGEDPKRSRPVNGDRISSAAIGKADWTQMFRSTAAALGSLFTVSNLLTWRFWLFLYLSLCITVHMAPSSSDYHGAKKGGLMLLGFWLALNLVHGLLGMSIVVWGGTLWPLWQMTIAMLVMAAGLGGVVAVAVFAVTTVWDLFLGMIKPA